MIQHSFHGSMPQQSDGSGLLDRYETSLRRLGERDRLRGLKPASGLDFASNDYLGLANHPRLRAALSDALEGEIPVGAGGSRLLRGNDPHIEALEDAAAEFFGASSVLFFGGGFVANYALLTTLPQKGDLILLDDLVHASCHDGARSARAETVLVAHNDAGAVEKAVLDWRSQGGKGRPWIVVESLYSMDGDRAPLSDLVAVADRQDGFLIIDEAHATGVFGPEGRGLSADFEGRDNVIILHTCGKALGASGAFVCLSQVLKDYLVNRCRPFIYATAPSPLMAVVVRESLNILSDEPQRRETLAHLINVLKEGLSDLDLPASGSQIQPVIVGDAGRAVRLANGLQERGFDIRAVRPPTVPEGTSRLRISLTLNVDEADVRAMISALRDEMERQST
ncbi:8-amino-7-oxononanoate synthase [Coralliovum pocilloporae]|uniref:8-amino-7-oxononanoate synthase n=1 Tax=Coralliovum pocilloporae TaxID=3066369 RepID=UPI00330738E8